VAIEDEFINNRKIYPTDIDIRKAMIEMKKWEKFKWDLIENIKVEKDLSKGFDYWMRLENKKKAKTKAFDDISDQKGTKHKPVKGLTSNYFASLEYFMKKDKDWLNEHDEYEE